MTKRKPACCVDTIPADTFYCRIEMDGRAVVVVVRVTGREQTHDLIFDVEGRVRRQDPPPTVDHVRGAFCLQLL